MAMAVGSSNGRSSLQKWHFEVAWSLVSLTPESLATANVSILYLFQVYAPTSGCGLWAAHPPCQSLPPSPHTS
jgi:hypothetical protein